LISFYHRSFSSQITKAFVFILLAFLSLNVSAQEEAEEAAQEAIDAAKPPKSWEQKLISGNISISEWFDGVAEGIDLFLVGKQLTTRQNDTSIRLETSTFVVEREGVSNSGSVNVNLRLPNVEEYWQLKFTSYDETEERRGVQRGDLRTTPRVKNYGATVGLFRKLGNIRTAFQPRISLQDPLKVAHSLSFESVADLKTYEVNPKLEFFANPDSGTGIFTAFYVHFKLTKVYSLTLINDGEYTDKTHLFAAANGFSIGQIVTDRSALSYSLVFGSANQPNYHLEGYSVAVTWNHLVYRRILDYRITPHVDFGRDKGFRGVPALTFTVGLTF
jgi:hypothetical protein